MAKYLYICEKEHVTEHVFPLGQNPDEVNCTELSEKDGITVCGFTARRYIKSTPPIRYNGTGFASTDIPKKSGLEGYYS